MFHGAILLKQRTRNTILAAHSRAEMAAFAHLTAGAISNTTAPSLIITDRCVKHVNN